MSKLLRYYADGQICFVTCVTADRTRSLIIYNSELQEAIRTTQERLRFNVHAYVFLPDHFHLIIDPLHNDLSAILQRIKLSYSRKVRYDTEITGPIWQKRFWDHIIRDQEDWNNHVNYIHYNPVKHGLVTNPHQWRYSSLHRYRIMGYYADDWGTNDKLEFAGDFGE